MKEKIGEIYLENEEEYKEYVALLKQKYGDEIPYDELYKFDYDWKIRWKNKQDEDSNNTNDYSKIEEIKWNEDILNGDNKVIASLPE